MPIDVSSNLPDDSAMAVEATKARPAQFSFSVYYGWAMVGVAAAAMVATFPGRTQGLGIITERLLADRSLGLSRTSYGELNLWATLIGALFCVGTGRWIDRYGVRAVLTMILVALGLSVLAMTLAVGPRSLFVGVLLTRGFGQSALSVVSLSIVGKWFRRRLNWAMSTYTAVLAFGYLGVWQVAGKYKDNDWHTVWGGIGILLLVAAPLAWLVTRNSPEQCGLSLDGERNGANTESDERREAASTLGQALATRAFWLFAMATSLFGLVSSGVFLFNESILADRGFDKSVYYQAMMIGALVAPASNLVAGGLMRYVGIGRLTGAALALLAVSLASLTVLSTRAEVVAWTVANGVAGGVITVVFFSVWAMLYGRAHLGKIQGAAQMLTVFASATGPAVFAQVKDHTGSYSGALVGLAGVAAVLAIAGWFVPLPKPVSDGRRPIRFLTGRQGAP